MLSDRTARVSYYSFLYALGYFERHRDGLEGEAVRVVGGGPRRRHRVDGALLGILLGRCVRSTVRALRELVEQSAERARASTSVLFGRAQS